MIQKLLKIGLMPADRVIIPKSEFHFIQHHGIYLGKNVYGTHLFAENSIGNGVSVVTADSFFKNTLEITRIEKFNGNAWERTKCLNRALALKGKSYDLLNFNCEHYSNVVQHNTSKSEQITNFFGWGLVALFVGGIFINTK